MKKFKNVIIYLYQIFMIIIFIFMFLFCTKGLISDLLSFDYETTTATLIDVDKKRHSSARGGSHTTITLYISYEGQKHRLLGDFDASDYTSYESMIGVSRTVYLHDGNFYDDPNYSVHNNLLGFNISILGVIGNIFITIMLFKETKAQNNT